MVAGKTCGKLANAIDIKANLGMNKHRTIMGWNILPKNVGDRGKRFAFLNGKIIQRAFKIPISNKSLRTSFLGRKTHSSKLWGPTPTPPPPWGFPRFAPWKFCSKTGSTAHIVGSLTRLTSSRLRTRSLQWWLPNHGSCRSSGRIQGFGFHSLWWTFVLGQSWVSKPQSDCFVNTLGWLTSLVLA